MELSLASLRGWLAHNPSCRTCALAIRERLCSHGQPSLLLTLALGEGIAWPSTPALLVSSLTYSLPYPHLTMHFVFSHRSASLPLPGAWRHVGWSSVEMSSVVPSPLMRASATTTTPTLLDGQPSQATMLVHGSRPPQPRGSSPSQGLPGAPLFGCGLDFLWVSWPRHKCVQAAVTITSTPTSLLPIMPCTASMVAESSSPTTLCVMSCMPLHERQG